MRPAYAMASAGEVFESAVALAKAEAFRVGDGSAKTPAPTQSAFHALTPR
jgi:hypothetical protein